MAAMSKTEAMSRKYPDTAAAKHARVVPCPCGGGKARRLADGTEVPQAEIHPDGTLSCMECGAPILAIQTDKEN